MAEFPAATLDSPQTLVLALGAKAFETPEPFAALAAAFSQSLIAGR